MRNRIGIIVLMLAVGFLGWSWGDRKRNYDQPMNREYAALYCAKIVVIDAATRRPIGFQIEWSHEVSPFHKGSGPSRIVNHPDGSRSIAVVGRRLEEGLPVEIRAEGYRSQSFRIEAQSGGIRTIDEDGDHAVTLALVREEASGSGP